MTNVLILNLFKGDKEPNELMEVAEIHDWDLCNPFDGISYNEWVELMTDKLNMLSSMKVKALVDTMKGEIEQAEKCYINLEDVDDSFRSQVIRVFASSFVLRNVSWDMIMKGNYRGIINEYFIFTKTPSKQVIDDLKLIIFEARFFINRLMNIDDSRILESVAPLLHYNSSSLDSVMKYLERNDFAVECFNTHPDCIDGDNPPTFGLHNIIYSEEGDCNFGEIWTAFIYQYMKDLNLSTLQLHNEEYSVDTLIRVMSTTDISYDGDYNSIEIKYPWEMNLK